MSSPEPAASEFARRIPELVRRVEAVMDRTLPAADRQPSRLHEAMRYATMNGGKRVRPLLTYAAGECLGVPLARLDVPAAAIEFIHAFSLVHDDLPAMDDDDLRRGQPTVHRKYDEATAILAADALQPLAFEIVARSDALDDRHKCALVNLIASACGSLGMTGGQAIDLASEGKVIDIDQLKEMHNLKTGALITASVMSAWHITDDQPTGGHRALEDFANDIGLAFQIRDDILDVQGETETIGKPAGSDAAAAKATWPALFGIEESIRYCDKLLQSAHRSLGVFGAKAEALHDMAELIVSRDR